MNRGATAPAPLRLHDGYTRSPRASCALVATLRVVATWLRAAAGHGYTVALLPVSDGVVSS